MKSTLVTNKRQYYLDLNGDLHPAVSLFLLLQHQEEDNFTVGPLSLFETNGLGGHQ